MIIETTCNTPDDVLFSNIAVNSRRHLHWLHSLPEHEKQAVLVGGGPSLKDWLDEIRYRKSNGQVIFALNNALKFLADNGIKADYQVIVDARESNLAFIGDTPCLLASQCHPSLFDKAQAVTLWHQEYPEDMARFDACLPDNHPAHTLIGGGTTVGLSAMVLAYAMGFRKLHLYGYDSSYRESRHAYPQTDPQNVDCVATVAGKSFHTSLAMARQAELFPELSDSLIDLGCIITIRGDGLLPWTSQQAAIHVPMAEPDKYAAMWAHDSYRNVSPGELVAQTFIEICKPSGLVADLGCGTGRGAIEIAKAGCEVVLVDFTENSRDPEAKAFNFLKADLSKPIPLRADYGYCCDVMEHIPPAQVDTVIKNVMAVAPKVFFQISTVPDQMGVLIGEKLHLSVHPLHWWIDRFNSLGFAVQWSEETENAALIYSTT